jgi:hypothetical protein
MASQNPIDIYQLLTGIQIDGATVTQLDSATGRTFVDKASLEFWQGILTLSHVMKAARTYAHGLPIPEASAMTTVSIDDGASGTIQPSGTEVWEVQAISLDNCIAFLTDGSGIMTVVLGGDNATVTGPLYLTSKLYLGFQNASGSGQTPGIAYHKVSL